MKSKVRWGIIGSGGIARRRTIPEGLQQAANAQLVSVFGPNRETNGEVAAKFGAIPCESLESLLASEIDAVYVASPVHAHAAQVEASARAGKHVLCEKPLGLSVKEAQNMTQACRDGGVQFGTAFMMRFQAQHQSALDWIRQGRLGRPVFARAQLSCWYPPMEKSWRQNPMLGGGGSLMDLGSHLIDLLEMFFGRVRSVSCFTNHHVHVYGTEDSSVVMLQFENGAMGTVDAFFCIPDNSTKNRLELYGSQGSILANETIGQGSQGEMTAYLTEKDPEYRAEQERGGQKGQVQIKPPVRNIYRAEIEAFSAAILEGKPNPLNSDIGLHSQQVLAACYESARTRKVVDIPGSAASVANH
jgi:predicted dehydrogenase